MVKKNKKAFTLTEVIATLAILGIILVIAIPGVGKLQEKFKSDYYTQLDKSVLAAGKNYYKDNQEERPVNLLEASSVGYSMGYDATLVNKKYIDSVKKYNDRDNCTGKVVVVKLEEDYQYVNCMNCGEHINYSNTINTTDYKKNICLFDSSDIIESIFDYKDLLYLYASHFDSSSLKTKLCLPEEIVRRKADGSGALYKIEKEDGEIKCPINISSVNSNKRGKYIVKYVTGKENGITSYKESEIIVFQHFSPEIVNENINKIGNVYYTKGELKIALSEENKKTFDSEYNSAPERFEYLDATNWETISINEYIGLIDTKGWDSKTTKFRIVGEDKTTHAEQLGEESNEYKITGKPITIKLLKNGGTGGTDSVNHWKGFKLTDSIVVPEKVGFEFKGYFEKNTAEKFYNADGSVYKTAVIMNDSDLELEAKWEQKEVGIPTYTFFATNSSHVEVLTNSNVKINQPIHFNVMVLNSGTPVNRVTVIFHDNSVGECEVNHDSNFFNAVSSKYTSANYTRYYCGSEKYVTNGKYRTEVEVLYKDASGVEKKVEPNSSIELIVPQYKLTYTNDSSICSDIYKPYGDKWGDLCQINKTGYTHGGWKASTGEIITSDTEVAKNVDVEPIINPNSYNVTYDANGGNFDDSTTTKTISTTYEKYYQLPTVPKQSGYKFVGWYTSSGTQVTGSSLMKTASNHRLYAYWEANSSTLEVEKNNGTAKSTYKGKYTERQTVPVPGKNSTTTKIKDIIVYFDSMGGNATFTSKTLELKEKKTYVFNSWNKKTPFYGNLDGNVYTFGKEEKITDLISAVYSNSTESIYSSFQLPTATRDGYIFKGWYTQSNNYIGEGGTSYAPSVDTTLFAHWQKEDTTYTIKFYKNDGSGSVDTKTCDINQTYCELVKYTRDNYSYNGWYKAGGSANTSTPYAFPSSSATVGATIEIYASWIPNKYTITLDNQSATSAGSSHVYEKYNTGIYLNSGLTTKMTTSANPITVPSKDGFVFKGYYTGINGSGSQLISVTGYITSNFTSTYFSKNSTLYAKWEESKYQITIDPNGGTFNGKTSNTIWTDISSGTRYYIAQPQREGYKFLGWQLVSGKGYIESENPTYFIAGSGDSTLMAKWQSNNAILGIYINDTPWQESGIKCALYKGNTLSYSYSSAIYSDSSVTWYGVSDGTYNVYASRNGSDIYNLVDTGIDITVSNDSVGVIIDYYDLLVSTGFGIDSTSGTGKYLNNSTINISATEKTGYTFTDWYTDIGNTPYNKNSKSTSVFLTTKTTLYARAAQLSYLVSYDANGGTGAPMSQTKYHGVDLTLSATQPTLFGYTFLGWSTSSNATTESYVAGGQYTSNNSTTLYAVWKPNTYSISYELNGGTNSSSNPTSYVYGTGVNSFYSPTKTGYIFEGWYKESSFSNKITSISSTETGAKTLYAKWKSNTYTLTVNPNGGVWKGSAQTSTISFSSGDKIAIDAPTREGYKFNGWILSGKGTFNQNTFTGDSENASLVATWQANSATIYIKKNDSNWSGSDIKVALYKNGVEKYSGIASGAVYVMFSQITEGTYDIYASKSDSNKTTLVDTKLDISVLGSGNTATINYYSLALNKDSNVSSVIGAGIYLKNISVNIQATLSNGYDFKKWDCTQGNSPTVETASSSLIEITSNTILKATSAPKKVRVRFYRNHSSSDSNYTEVTYTYGERGSFSSNGYSRTNWTLKGWSSEKNITNATKSNYTIRDTNFTVTDNWILTNSVDQVVNMYAVWERTFVATFDPGLVTTASEQKRSCTIYNYESSCSVTAPGLTIAGTTKRAESTNASYASKGNQKYGDYVLTFRCWTKVKYQDDAEIPSTDPKYEENASITLNHALCGDSGEFRFYAYVRLQNDVCGKNIVAFANEENGLYFRSGAGMDHSAVGILLTNIAGKENPKVVIKCGANFRFASNQLWVRAYMVSGGTCSSNANTSGSSCGSSSNYKWVSANWLSFPET